MKVLFSAIVAAAAVLAAGPASAQDSATGVKLGVSGYFKGYVVYADQNTDGLRETDIIRDTEVHLTGSTTLDNGLTVGADIGTAVDVGDSSDITDSFVYFSGNWGRVNAGATDGAGYLLQVTAPAADANYDGMDQYYTPFTTAGTAVENVEFDYDQDLSTPNDKLTYITPVYSGFQAGISWTPKVGNSRGLNGVSSDSGLQDIIDLAARFENETSWGSYRAGVGYETAEERQLWNAALDFDIGAFGVGAVYTHDNMDDAATPSTATSQRQYILGVDYTTGNYVLAASYLNQKNEFGADDVKTNRYTGGVTYNYGPGIDFHGVVSHIDHDVDAALGDDVKGTSLMLGTSISF